MKVLLFLALLALVVPAVADEFVVFERGDAKARIVIPSNATPAEKDAAEELARFLQKSSGAKFEIIAEGNSDTGIFIGRTQRARMCGLTERDLGDEGYVIRVNPLERRAAIVGGSDMATKFGVYDFLYRFVGVRWFLPTELFEIVPRRERLTLPECDITEKPALSPRSYSHIRSAPSPCYPGNRDPQFGSERWGLRNRISADGRGQPRYFSHNLYRIINPRIYGKTHPEYFPLRDGVRFVPESLRYQNWQPCTTNPDVIRIAIEHGRKFFRENPEHWKWFSLGINDGNGWCECKNCTALDVPGRTFRRRKFIASDRYYHFVSIVARKLLQEFPDRKIGVIAYASVEPRPLKIDKLPPNVCVYITHDSSQYHDPEYLKQDLEFDQIWKALSNNNLYRYDYYGLTWFLPRYFPHLIAEDMRRMKKMGVRGIFAEECPAWQTVGPMLYVAARLMWNPEEDVDELLDEFFDMCFGAAAQPMKKYWTRLEKIWMKERPGKWFEGLNDLHAQTALYSEDDLNYCNEMLDEALRLAGDDELVRKRILFFRSGWRLAAGYIRENLLLGKLGEVTAPENIVRIASDALIAVSERHKYWQSFRDRDEFLSGSYRWFLETLHRDGDWEMFVQKKAQCVLVSTAAEMMEKSPRIFERVISRLESAGVSADIVEPLKIARKLKTGTRPPNLLKNPSFVLGEGTHPKGIDWSSRGAPPDWAVWRLSKGEFKFRDGVASVRGADDGVVIQSVPVATGEKVAALVRYRMKAEPPAKALIVLRWKQQDGKWLVSGERKRQGMHMVRLELPPSEKWREVFIVREVPRGAAQAVFMFGGRNQQPDDVAEFTQPYFSKVK